MLYDMSNDIPTRSDLLSARDLAAALGVTSATVRRWVRAEHLVPTEITYGGYYRFDLEDAKKQLEAQRFVRNRQYHAQTAHEQHRDPENVLPGLESEYIQAALDTDE